ncbi:transmembrane protein 235-like [Oncorhynchus nerka]|uniref:transmembrane protein 235-like n=1 Tax=Oncorhynchus nerka TaxID=8023 RepID=UPI00227B93FD|nr:transmembrane protein 235 isoform X1 [Oncorhynchus keta]XP_052375604.1 transmembrane protein 235 isoform X2 [Oncorhynchus keta]
MKYGMVVITAGFSGLLSFSFLAVAIGSDYWYIIDVNKANQSDLEDLSSHSGLWRIREGRNGTSWPIQSFFVDTSNKTDIEKHLINSHKVIVTLLPLSLLLVVLGGICGLVSSLARNPSLLAGSASYFLFCSLFTLSGLSVYVSYCQRARELLEPEILASVHVSYGWSLGMACLSFSLEVTAGLLLMLAARKAHLMGRDHGVTIIAMA